MLVGVGLGPGDPGLLTLRAVQVLRESRAVFVPGRIAAEIVEPYCDPVILDFPMTRDENRLRSSWEKAAQEVAESARRGLTAFGALGDPNFFATFTHLRRIIQEKHPEIGIKTVPGVSAITAFASSTGVPVESSFQVEAGTPTSVTLVLKAVNPRETADRLAKRGYHQFILIENLSRKNEKITEGGVENMPPRAAYLSILYAKKT